MANRPLSPKELQETLQKYKSAYEEEFKLSQSPDEKEIAGIVQRSRSAVAELTPKAIATLAHLMDHGDRDAVRLKAAMYVIDQGLAKNGALTPEDELTVLINKLQKSA